MIDKEKQHCTHFLFKQNTVDTDDVSTCCGIGIKNQIQKSSKIGARKKKQWSNAEKSFITTTEKKKKNHTWRKRKKKKRGGGVGEVAGELTMAGISRGNTQERNNSLLPPTKSQNNYRQHKTATITTHCKTDTTKERTACYYQKTISFPELKKIK